MWPCKLGLSLFVHWLYTFLAQTIKVHFNSQQYSAYAATYTKGLFTCSKKMLILSTLQKNCQNLNQDLSKINSHCFKTSVQLPTYTDNVALLTFTHYMPLLQQLFDISCPPGPQQQTCSSAFAADRWTPYHFINPALCMLCGQYQYLVVTVLVDVVDPAAQ